MAVRHYQAAICMSDLWTCVFPWVPKRGKQVKQMNPHYSIMEKACHPLCSNYRFIVIRLRVCQIYLQGSVYKRKKG